jgi:hypothetical protein
VHARLLRVCLVELWLWLWQLRPWLCWWSRFSGEAETILKKRLAKQFFLAVSHRQVGEIPIMPFFFFSFFLLIFFFFPFYPFTISPHILHLIHSPRIHQPPPPRLPTPTAGRKLPTDGLPQRAAASISSRSCAPAPAALRPPGLLCVAGFIRRGRTQCCGRRSPPASWPAGTAPLTGVLLHLPSRPPLKQRPSTFITSTALWWPVPVLHPPPAPSSLALGANQ